MRGMEVMWENPSYDTDLEPPVLKRLKCQVCAVRWADVQCQLCSQQLCRDCEASVHRKIPDAAVHQASMAKCNVCQDCQSHTSEFYCKDCDRYQCEHCCTASHTATDAVKRHVRMTMEGAAPRSLRFSTWSTEFVEFTKMARRNLQVEMEKQAIALAVKEETGGLPEFLPLPPVGEDSDATSDEETHHGQKDDAATRDALEIKMERVQLSGSTAKATAAAPPVSEEDALMQEPDTAVPIKPEPATATSKPTSSDVDVAAEHSEKETARETKDIFVKDESAGIPAGTQEVPTSVMMQSTWEQNQGMDVEIVEPPPVIPDVVDLTGDDDDDENTPPLDTNARFVKKEESMWSAKPSSVAEGDFFLDNDPIRSQLVRKYNTESKRIDDVQQHAKRLTERATVAASNLEIQDCKAQLEKLQDVTAKANHVRDGILARLIVYVKHSDPEFQKLLAKSGLDMPDAQAGIHRECARLQAEINAKGGVLRTCQAQVDEAIRLKPTESFMEVVRLGEEIKASEDAIRELEETRLKLLENLPIVSEAIRAAARVMMSESISTSS